MLEFDDQTRMFLNEIRSPFQKQFALFLYSGMTPTDAYIKSCSAYGQVPAEDPTRAARQLSNVVDVKAFLDTARRNSSHFIESESLFCFVDRMRYLGNAMIAGDLALSKGNMAGGPVVINAVKQSHVMMSTGSSDEFTHLSVDELKRLAGESD